MATDPHRPYDVHPLELRRLLEAPEELRHPGVVAAEGFGEGFSDDYVRGFMYGRLHEAGHWRRARERLLELLLDGVNPPPGGWPSR